MVQRIPVGLVYGNPDQPRKHFDPTALGELAGSIRENGLLQPITVRPDGDGRFMIVMGERRFRAFLINAAREPEKWDEIPAHVSEVDDKQLAIDAIIENDQRVDVTPMEQARAYQRMMDEYGFDLDSLAVKLGKAPHRITERTALLKLTPENQQLVERGQITMGQAWYLMQLSPQGQGQMLRAINRGLCPTTQALKAAFETIHAAEAQDALFVFEPPSAEHVRQARTFEDRVERVAALLRESVVDNEVKAVAKVDRGRAGTLAELLGAMQKDLQRIEVAIRAAAVCEELAA